MRRFLIFLMLAFMNVDFCGQPISGTDSILHPASCILHPASCILHPASCILHPPKAETLKYGRIHRHFEFPNQPPNTIIIPIFAALNS
jgi:hypothetical protein